MTIARHDSKPPAPRKSFRVLFLASNPKNSTELRLGEEIRSIQERMRASNGNCSFDIAQEWAVRVSDLQSSILRHSPDIVHFSGHGSNAGEIILENVSGQSVAVPPVALAKLFESFSGDIKIVLLNACFSANQAKAISKSIDFVVGMSQSIGDQSAIQFAAAFYEALSYGKNFKTAFDLGCTQIDLHGLNQADIPRMLIRKRSGAETNSLA